MLGGIDDPSMKHTFITSFPRELSDETFCLIKVKNMQVKVKNKQVSTTSAGEIFQYVIEAVEKLCSWHDYFKNLMKGTINIKHGCKRPNLSIKGDDLKTCLYRTKKKKHFKR